MIVGQEAWRQWSAGLLSGERLGPRETPFGPSGAVFRIDDPAGTFYLLGRYGEGLEKTAPQRVNARANLYALKDLGVRAVLAWGAGGAVTHELAVGDLVLLDDLIDQTHRHDKTFFENSPLGYLRQFPVFCPVLREAAGRALGEMHLPYRVGGTGAVSNGPRLETPAEVRMLSMLGATVVTHNFAPEAFLARELQLCYAAVCYIVGYAETGSRHRPFVPGGLFASAQRDRDPVASAVRALGPLSAKLAVEVAAAPEPCECAKAMADRVRDLGLSPDWHTWFA